MFERIVILDAEGTMFRGERADGSSRIIDGADPEMMALLKQGVFGQPEPFVPAEASPPAPNPVFSYFRIAMVAADAVARGVADPSDQDIQKMLEEAFDGKN